ncbi:carboxypeptidase regulatory-like domain-containing protein [bacterium]|nr:carboxypeptidase regulatory-like domain-containing protein [bacterium]
MKKIFLTFVLILGLIIPTQAANFFQGGVEKEIILGGNSVVDAQTNLPIQGAKITLPLDGYSTKSDAQGHFNLNANISAPTVLSIEKEGYKPFSLTINKLDTSKPLVLAIEKSTLKDLTLDTQMFHLGDNSFSPNSANAREFQVESIGPFYTKNFNIPKTATKASLVIGSIIGLDTKMAKAMGQNKISNAYSSPAEVFFNGIKISELQLNGDGQKIKLPPNLIKAGSKNEITIKTGRNMLSENVDYDDIEIMNISLETE